MIAPQPTTSAKTLHRTCVPSPQPERPASRQLLPLTTQVDHEVDARVRQRIVSPPVTTCPAWDGAPALPIERWCTHFLALPELHSCLAALRCVAQEYRGRHNIMRRIRRQRQDGLAAAQAQGQRRVPRCVPTCSPSRLLARYRGPLIRCRIWSWTNMSLFRLFRR